ncbi:MAG: hypothetical protein ACREBU_00480 [Nitrososphaera sp.]
MQNWMWWALGLGAAAFLLLRPRTTGATIETETLPVPVVLGDPVTPATEPSAGDGGLGQLEGIVDLEGEYITSTQQIQSQAILTDTLLEAWRKINRGAVNTQRGFTSSIAGRLEPTATGGTVTEIYLSLFPARREKLAETSFERGRTLSEILTFGG